MTGGYIIKVLGQTCNWSEANTPIAYKTYYFSGSLIHKSTNVATTGNNLYSNLFISDHNTNYLHNSLNI